MGKIKVNLSNDSRFSPIAFKYLEEVFNNENQSATNGSMCQRLEAEVCRQIGTNYGIAFNSGTSTLHACLLALGIGKGDEVIIPSIGPIMDTFAVIQTGATPVFADIIEGEYTIDYHSIHNLITPNTKAIIVVHIYGYGCRMDDIMDLANDFEIPVIEDCAQAYQTGIIYRGELKLAGSIGMMASFSFESSKHISCGEGGMVLCNDEALAKKIRQIGGLGFGLLEANDGLVRRDENIFKNPDFKRHSMVG
ncbi:MAG TPA: DegT/DnrJ/EryC1/StrS family aminotransferase, partial [Candidatus Nitrosocosmicus sp.]|nr:DegT/DnrJ/EryC1/StrS family aminotransferase [Candidatus Nitrosocosmicus sp.]